MKLRGFSFLIFSFVLHSSVILRCTAHPQLPPQSMEFDDSEAESEEDNISETSDSNYRNSSLLPSSEEVFDSEESDGGRFVSTTEKYADEPETHSFNYTADSSKEIVLLRGSTNADTRERDDHLEKENGPSYTLPLPLTSHQTDEDIDEKLFLILQNAVRETYFAYRDILGKRYRDQINRLEDDLRSKLHQIDVDLNVKIVALDTTTHSRIQVLTDQLIDQRKEDIQTFSDNLHQLQKTHQMHIDSQKVEIQQLQASVDLLNKGQSSVSTKMSQMQKNVNNLESKINDIVNRYSDDLVAVQESQKTMSVTVDELENNLKTSIAELNQIQVVVQDLEKAATEDHSKLRRTMIRDQKQEPIQSSIRHLRNKNVGGALKHWRAIEAIADDLKETLPADITKIIDDSYGKNAANMNTILEFIHRAVSHGDRRLKEAAYNALLQDMDPTKQLTDHKKTIDVINLAQTLKTDLGSYYNTSATTANLVSKLPEIIRLITFEKVKLLLPTRGYLRVAADRKVTLVSPEGRFYDKDEIQWTFEYDKDKSDGTFFIKSDKLQKYLVTLHEGFNSYGFSKQGLFVTGNKRENGTRFQVNIVNNGEYVLLKSVSVHHNGFLTWKSNIQTIYGDDDSYFLLLVDRKNGPSPYWNILPVETHQMDMAL